MADLPAKGNSDKAEQNASKTIRENVCPHLKELMDDIL